MEDLFESTVLFVDDETDILDILHNEFKPLVGHVFIASDPEVAEDIVKNFKVDLMVADVKMPKMDGPTLYKKLLEGNPNLQCIFLSGFGDKETVQTALRLGAENFIDKPFDINFLRLAVVRALEKARHEQLLREILELFIHHYTSLDFSKFSLLSPLEKEQTMKAALGVAKLQILNKQKI